MGILYNLYTTATIYETTAEIPGYRSLDIRLGDGTNNLNTAASVLTLTLVVASQTRGPTTITKEAGIVRWSQETEKFWLEAGETLTATLKSSHSSDTNVGVTVLELGPAEYHDYVLADLLGGLAADRCDGTLETTFSPIAAYRYLGQQVYCGGFYMTPWYLWAFDSFGGLNWYISSGVGVMSGEWWQNTSGSVAGEYTAMDDAIGKYTGGEQPLASDSLFVLRTPSPHVQQSAASAIEAKFAFVGDRVKSVSASLQSGICGQKGIFLFDLDVAAAEGFVISAEGSTTEDVPILDRVRTTTTHYSAIVGTQWQVTPRVLSHDEDWTEEIGDPLITYSSSDESVATVDAAGVVHYVSNGTCEIIAVSEAIGNSPARRVVVSIANFSSIVDPYQTVAYSDAPGSVRANATTAIDGRISAEKEKTIFSTQDHAAGIYVRNANCWADDLNLTCISPWNSLGGACRGGTLISPRHIVLAAHYPISVGSTIRFVDASNNVVSRTVLGTQNAASDIQVAVLSSDITGCGFAKVLPSDYDNYLPSNGAGIPVFGLDQEEKALVRDVGHLNSDGRLTCVVPTDETRLLFYEPIVGGDSGNPVFMIIGGELVLLTTWWHGNAGDGPAVHHYRSEINAAMAALDAAHGFSPAYSLTAINLSSYNTYGV